MKGLKGATILAEVISFIFLIITGYALTGTIIFAYGVSTVEQALTSDNLEYHMTMTAGYFPIQNEVMLLSMLETDCASNECAGLTGSLTLTSGWNNGILIPELERIKVSDLPDCIDYVQGQDVSGNWIFFGQENWLEKNIPYNILTTVDCTWTGDGIPMKILITECLIQGNSNPYIKEIAKTINVNDAITAAVSGWGTKKYSIIIRKGNGNIINLAGTTTLAEEINSGKLIKFQKISSEVFSPFETGFLELYVFDNEVTD
ncbi:MAG: hypothetical protein KJ697_04285 [Nanoarchaeota archaeon]|nr:hypothetical protein [Nanoarchaeota archaeon]MBU4124335.1 hypothetical protein [Nanoarchaeota archaeon]